jgi:hypothetical protein
MPTYTTLPRFDRDYARLPPEDQKRFKQSVRKFIEDLERGEGFRAGLRVRGIQGAPGIFEMSWAPNGRATFEYGEPRKQRHAHILWRRIDTHAVLDTP